MLREIKQIARFVLKKNYRTQVNNILKTSEYVVERESQNPSAKSVLIIQRINEMVGTYSDYIVFLNYIDQAIRKNMIPVIDRKTNKNYFLNGAEDENTWEFFFEQPCNITLNDLDKPEINVFRCYTADVSGCSLMKCTDEQVIQYWRTLAKKYIRLNASTQAHVDK